MKIKTGLFLVVLALWLAACGEKPAEAPPDKPRGERSAHAVETVLVAQRPARIARTLTGTLEAPRIVHIHSEQAGRILELPYYEGDRVKAEATLARLDDALIRAELDMAVASRKQAELDLKRLERIVPQKLATEDQLARADTALELARAAESLQRTRLSRTVIEAPFAGVISERLKEPGDAVPVNEPLLTLLDPDFITAAVQVPEQLFTQVAVGNAVKVRIDSLGEKLFPGEILRVHPQVNPATRQGTVEVRLKPVPKGARPGQLCRVTIESAPTPRRILPLNAVQYDPQGSYVFRVDGESKVQRVAVRTGLQFGEEVEILEGVNDGDAVVVKGFLDLRAGTKVQVVGGKQTSAGKPKTPENP